MNIFVVLGLTMLLIVLLLRWHKPLGLCMLAGGILAWVIQCGDFSVLLQACGRTFCQNRTYDLIAALYFVMCLEIELRTSGTLAGLVAILKRMFSSAKVTLVVMPAFLGMLPSLGGARFSAPIVDEASKNLELTAEHKSAINFWFRHPAELFNPIIPGMIMACSIAEVPYSEFAQYIAWVSLVYLAVGYFFLIRPIRESEVKFLEEDETRGSIKDIVLALSPIVLTFLIVVITNMMASLAMAITVVFLYLALCMMKRRVSLHDVIFKAVDRKMFLNILCILCFINILDDTGILRSVCEAFESAPLPIPVIIAVISFVIGILTGMSQAHVSIVMPIVAAMQTGDLRLASVAMTFGVMGQMLTPTHMCFVVTLDYFHANIFKTLKPLSCCAAAGLVIVSMMTSFFL